jgi:hypothetical protein
MINGYLFKVEYFDRTIEYDKDFEVYDNGGLRMVPVVELAGRRVEVYSYGPTLYRYGDAFEIPVYERYDLEVKHFWGNAFCRLVMPADFRVTMPPDTYILDKESTLVSRWRKSRAAHWYWVSIYAGYDYNDTTGVWDFYEFTLDTLVLDTCIAIPPERIFPPIVGDVLEGDALITVWGGNGPAVEPGDLGNVRGIGFGFVNAINQPRERYFYVGAPPLVRRSPDGHAVLERFKTRLRSRMPMP